MRTMILILLLCTGLQAAPILTINNPNLSVAAGETGDWEFRLQADETRWLSVIGSFLLFETDPQIGVYEDEIGLQGGPDGRIAPGAADWNGVLARYVTSPETAIGAFNGALLVVLYELFNDDPFTCDSCLVGSGSFTADVSVSVVEPTDVAVPEPSTWRLLLTGAGLLALTHWRRRRC